MNRGEVYLQHRPSSVAALLIVSNNACNRYSDNVTCVPIAKKTNRNLPTHVVIPKSSFCGELNDMCVALCEKIQMVKKATLSGPIACITDVECMEKINHSLKVQIGLVEAHKTPESFCGPKVSDMKHNAPRIPQKAEKPLIR